MLEFISNGLVGGGGRVGWQTWSRGLRASRGEPAVTLQGDRGAFRLNRSAAQAIGDPETIELLWDADARRVGFHPIDPGAESALRLSSHKGGSYLEVNAKAFCDFTGIPLGTT